MILIEISVDIDIPSKTFTRGKKTVNKHLGFAFVQFESKEIADKAISDFNGKEFKGRKIYVKKAVPPPTEEEKQRKVENFKAKRAEQQAKRAEAQAQEKKEGAKKANGESKNSKNKKSGNKKKDAASNKNAEVSDEKPNSDEERKAPVGKPATDTIFITNLDYKVNVKSLNSLFSDLKPKWIHVPSRRLPLRILKKQKSKGRTVFNKGIAFVKFSNEDAQKEAISKFNGKELNGREIIVDVAIDARTSKEEDVNNENENNGSNENSEKNENNESNESNESNEEKKNNSSAK